MTMTDTTFHDTEARSLELQILTAQDGTADLLPRALVDAARLTPEEAAAFDEAERSGDVQGLVYAKDQSLSWTSQTFTFLSAALGVVGASMTTVATGGVGSPLMAMAVGTGGTTSATTAAALLRRIG